MKKMMMTIVVATLLLVTLSCSFSVNAPKISTGNTQTFTVNEPVLTGNDPARIDVQMGAGKLNIAGGAANAVEGTIRYNVFAWEPKVTREGNLINIHQGTDTTIKIPDDDVINEWDLKLGSTPIDLAISAGAYEGRIDLSGVSLTNLNIKDGASKATIVINSTNPVEMETFQYATGASQVNITGISNANASSFKFDGGAGDFTLDFSGELQRDLQVDIKAGVSSLTIIVPENIPTRVTVSGGLNNVSPQGTWTITGNTYAKSGSGPSINIYLEMGVGSLKLVNQ